MIIAADIVDQKDRRETKEDMNTLCEYEGYEWVQGLDANMIGADNLR